MANKRLQIDKLIGKIHTFIYHIDNMEDYEKKFLQDLLNEQDHEEFRDLSVSLAECHVIDCIERNEKINTTAIAQKMNITKGGISKITAKLIKKNMIEIQRLPNNQKEFYYTLTPLGKKVFTLHEILHEQAQQTFIAVFKDYSDEELELAGKVFKDLTKALQFRQLKKTIQLEVVKE